MASFATITHSTPVGIVTGQDIVTGQGIVTGQNIVTSQDIVTGESIVTSFMTRAGRPETLPTPVMMPPAGTWGNWACSIRVKTVYTALHCTALRSYIGNVISGCVQRSSGPPPPCRRGLALS